MLYPAFILGLLSSLHCIGMCGPIAMMLPVDRNNPTRKALQILTYHSGRIIAYSIIGLLFGLLGKGLFLAGFQQRLSVVSGLAMIAIAILPEKTFARYALAKPVFQLLSKMRNAMGKRLKSKDFTSLFLIGLLNGFLPCGMVYAALFGAIAMQDTVFGVFFMVLFGIGTVPLMTSVVYFKGMLNMSIRNKIQKIIPYAMAGIGILFILRGLGLGIPYVSPSDMSLFVKAMPNCR